MESASCERVDSRSPRRTPKTPRNQSVIRGQPLLASTQRKKTKKKKAKAEDEYFLKSILKEEYRNGELYYLIDWQGTDAQTGKPYDPSWEPARNANEAAIKDWENTKKQKEAITRSNGDQDQSQEFQTQSSEPIRPAKRKRSIQHQQSATPERIAKKTKRRNPPGRNPSCSATPQSGSKQSPSPLQALVEIKDSYEEELFSNTPAPLANIQNAFVEISPLPASFDSGDYQPISSSPAFQEPQIPQHYSSSASASQAHTVSPSPPFRRPSRLSQVFVEDDIEIDSPVIAQQQRLSNIPSKQRLVFLEDDIQESTDSVTLLSQDLDGSSSYKSGTAPALSAGSSSAPNTRPNTQTDRGTETLVASSSQPANYEDSPQIAGDTSTSESYLAGSSSYRPSTGHPQDSESIDKDSNTQVVVPESLEENAQESIQEGLEPSLTLSKGFGVSTDLETRTGLQENNRDTSPASVEKNPFDQVEGHISNQSIESPGTTPDLVQNFASLDNEGSYSKENNSELVAQSQHLPSNRKTPQSSGRESPQRAKSINLSSKKVQAHRPSTPAQRRLPRESSTTPPPNSRIEVQISPATEDISTRLTTNSQRGSPPRSSPANPLMILALVHTPQRSAQQRSRLALSSPSISILPSIEGAENVSSPATPASRANMDEAPVLSTPGQDAKVLLRESRLRAIARKQAERAARSTSTVTLPATPPPPMIPDAPLALREVMVEKSPPMPASEPVVAPHRDSPKASPKNTPLTSRKSSPEPDLEDAPEDDTTTSLSIPPLGLGEYIIPMPLVAQTRDVYVQIIWNNKQERLNFLGGDADESVAMKIDEMLDDLSKICDHQDLILGEDYSTQRAALIEHQSNYAQTISTKCIFIAELAISLRSTDKHLVILSRRGRMCEILEAVLNTNGFVKPKGSNTFFDSSNGSFRVSILSSDGYNGELGLDSASIVVAFSPVSEIGSYAPIRANAVATSQVAPFVSLVISHSIEHLSLCFGKKLTGTERNVQLVTCLSQIQDSVGKLSAAEWPPPPRAAKDVAEYLMSDMEGLWPIPEMPIIEDIEIDRFSSQAESVCNQEPSGSTTQSYNDSSADQFASPLPKRQLIKDDADYDSPKRQRLTPLPDERVVDSEVTHISNTTDISSSAKFPSQLAGPQVAAQLSHANGDVQIDRATALLQKVDDLEKELQRKNATEAELRLANLTLDKRCRSLESDINHKIEPKFREALDDRSRFESEITKSLQDQTKLQKNADARNDEVTKYKEERDRLQEELKQMQIALSSSSIPEIAEFNKLKDQIRDLQTDFQKAEKRRLSAVNDGGFFQNQYQILRSEFDDSNFEKKALETEVALLRIKASDNAVRIHEIHNSSEVEQHLDRIHELTAENREYERELKRKDEELKAMAGGRRGTRGTSVPRSPRMVPGTMSPGVARERAIGGVSRVIAQSSGPRSRGSSPANVEFPGRQFGGELFQGSGGPGRWGHHLQ